MTDEINEVSAATERAVKNSTTAEEFKSQIESDLQGSTVVFSRRGDQNEIYGWSIQLPGATSLKGSELGRHLSWGRIHERLLANSTRAKRRERFLRIAPAPLEQRIHAEKVRPLRPLQAPQPQPQPQPQRAPGGMPIPSYTCREAESGGRIFEYLDEGGNVVISDELDAEDACIYLSEDAVHDEEAVENWLALGDSRLKSFSIYEGSSSDEEFLEIVVRVAARRGFNIEAPPHIVERISAERERLAAELRAAAGGAGGQREVDPLAFLSAATPPVPAECESESGSGAAAAPPVFDEFSARAAEARRILALDAPAWISDSAAQAMGVEALKTAARDLQALEPVAAWVASARQRVGRDGFALSDGRQSAADLVLLQAEERARFEGVGRPIATELARIACRVASADLLLAKRAKDEAQASLLGRFRLPSLETKIEQLQSLVGDRQAEYFKARSDFDAAHRVEIQAMQSRIDCYLFEKKALEKFEFIFGPVGRGGDSRSWLTRAQEQVAKHVLAKEESKRFRAALEVPSEVLQEDARDDDQQRDRFEVPRCR